MKHFLPEEELIEYVKPYLKAKGFKKKNKRWTNKSLIKERLIAFMEWEERNPLEKRRAKLVDYEKAPVPTEEFFGIDSPPWCSPKQYILDNF